MYQEWPCQSAGLAKISSGSVRVGISGGERCTAKMPTGADTRLSLAGLASSAALMPNEPCARGRSAVGASSSPRSFSS